LETEDRVHVMAAALVDARGRVLLQRRAASAHQGGLWEFPGGKLEAGEGREQGLIRELEEELGVRPRSMRPLISIAHDYPDRRVLLDVWRVDRWHGEVSAKEGQPLAWVLPAQLNNYEFPAADRAVLNALNLPDLVLITPPIGEDFPTWASALRRAVSRGLSVVQIRSPRHDSAQLMALLAPLITSIAHDAPQVRVMVNCEPEIAAAPGIAGVHLTARRLWQYDARPIAADRLLGASCHHAEDLLQAARIGVDFAVLGPVARTTSHPDTAPLGWERFSALVADARVPVYALGGLGRNDVSRAQAAGAQGVAAISALWN
jgi:8-oxo-dGTP diphosphatase